MKITVHGTSRVVMACAATLFLTTLFFTGLARPASAQSSLSGEMLELIKASGPGPGQLEVRLKLYGPSNDAFEAAWSAYTARKKEVAAIVARAEAQAKSDPAGAVKTLWEAIGEVTLALNDRIAVRQIVERADGELEAVIALAKIAKKTRDYPLWAKLVRAMFGRRKISDDKERERMLWFAYRNHRSLSRLTAGAETKYNHRVQNLDSEMMKVLDDARAATGGFWDGFEDWGITPLRAGILGTAKKGSWVVLHPPSVKVDGSTLTYAFAMAVDVPYNCKPTRQIDRIDPLTGKVSYKEHCSFRRQTINERLEAALTSPAPDWVKDMGAGEVWVVGKVASVKAPGFVKLQSAFIPDLRCFYGGRRVVWEPGEYEYVAENAEVKVFRYEKK